MNEEKTKRLAWPTAWFSITLVFISLVISAVALSAGGAGIEPPLHQIFSPIFAITYSLIGGLVASRRPHNPVGWIAAAVGFFYALSLVTLSYGMLGRSLIAEGSLPGENLALWIEQWTWFPPAILPMTLLLLLFPDGRLPSRRWRPIAWACVAGLIIATLFMAIIAGLYPGERLEMGTIEASLGKGSAKSPYYYRGAAARNRSDRISYFSLRAVPPFQRGRAATIKVDGLCGGHSDPRSAAGHRTN